MSAAFKNSRKKLSQTELRKYMNEHKSKPKDVKKIDSPLAKYNDQGQLTCVLCQSIVRSEAVWTVHINAKQHKLKIEEAKKLKERTNNFTTPLKRPLTPPLLDVPEKKLKSILKNSSTNKIENANSITKTNSNLSEEVINLNIVQKMDVQNKPIQLDNGGKMQSEDIPESKDVLPEGFFDDPKLDAKARNQEYKDPIEEEWEKFVKAIKEADNESNAIIAEDQEEATNERQIDEIDEQMKKLSRVLDLEKKKVEIISASNESKSTEINEDDDDMADDEFDEFLDWRAKKSFK